MNILKNNKKTTRQEMREKDALMIIDAYEAAKKLVEHRTDITGIVEMSVAGLKLQIRSKEAFEFVCEEHIRQAHMLTKDNETAKESCFFDKRYE